MKGRFKFVLAAFIAVASQSWAAVTDGDLRTAAAADLALAIDLYPRLRSGDQNLVFSTPGLTTLLALVGTGARGRTRADLCHLLHVAGASPETLEAFGSWRIWFGQNPGDGNQLEWTTTISVGRETGGIFPAFLADAQTNFGAQLASASSLDPPDGIVLKNHIHFFGHWEAHFETADTTSEKFYLRGSRPVRRPFMHRIADFRVFHTDHRWIGSPHGVTLLELPYRGQVFSMIVILPDDSGGLRKAEDSLSLAGFEKWMAELGQAETIPVSLSFPRFEAHSDEGLMSSLVALGLGVADMKSEADFSGLSPVRAYIADVGQKAEITADEEGTTATADTGVTVLAPLGIERGSKPEPEVITVDHPFLYVIRDNLTGAPLFFGRICDPAN